MTTIISTSTESHKKERENTKDDNVHKQRKCLKLELKYISYGKLRIERKNRKQKSWTYKRKRSVVHW